MDGLVLGNYFVMRKSWKLKSKITAYSFQI